MQYTGLTARLFGGQASTAEGIAAAPVRPQAGKGVQRGKVPLMPAAEARGRGQRPGLNEC